MCSSTPTTTFSYADLEGVVDALALVAVAIGEHDVLVILADGEALQAVASGTRGVYVSR
jgi:hypothetical protein